MSQLKIKNGNNWESIPAGGIGVPSGGSSGQYLKKSSSTDYATEWADLPTNYIIMDIPGTWSNIASNAYAYILISDVPNGYLPISASLEWTTETQNSAFVHAWNPTRFYVSGVRDWITRLHNASNASITIKGTVHVLCVRVAA